ncbi:class I SAM-dependent methyltransferase [Lentzea sp. BCCO 10_0856]|uniref:Class I SAM-dependent methyltransferase n=1 Tax=Lentzea miocenica TaxID=3095431 RepID=A0ABU4SUV3_9PSEU|nr:class I SAM-dependent methyltransferase [Lentzea sp. BCCO 10_0856]MDX8029685.1 class I SAM-dependent methyltransferase [Lentzea sp. BCCO 10_0856]
MPTLDNEELGKRLASSFGADAARYDRTRPPYPDELVQRIVTASPGPRVVDVGCGTGKLSRQLQAAGLDVLGVEHDENMAGFALATAVPVEVSKFETWDPAGREFDAVVAGQSWHWVNAEEGQRQAARVLRPGGVFVALWHVFAMPDPVAEALADVYQKVAPEIPFRVGYKGAEILASYRSGCERTAESFVATGEFTGSDLWSTRWDQSYTTAEYLDLILTMSPLALLTTEQVTEVLDCVGAAIDAAGGGFTMNYETLAVAVTRN